MTRPAYIRRAFSLLELLIAMTVLAVIAAMVMPGFQQSDRLRVMAAASILASDLEYAQVLNITMPEMPVVVQFDLDNDRYWLAYEWDPNTPIVREDTGEVYLVELGVGRARSAAGVTLSLADPRENLFGFDPQGAIQGVFNAPEITVSMGEESLTLTVALSTGTITQSAP